MTYPTVYAVFKYWLSNERTELMAVFASEESARAYCRETTKDNRSIAGIVCWRYLADPDKHLQIVVGALQP